MKKLFTVFAVLACLFTATTAEARGITKNDLGKCVEGKKPMPKGELWQAKALRIANNCESTKGTVWDSNACECVPKNGNTKLKKQFLIAWQNGKDAASALTIAEKRVAQLQEQLNGVNAKLASTETELNDLRVSSDRQAIALAQSRVDDCVNQPIPEVGKLELPVPALTEIQSLLKTATDLVDQATAAKDPVEFDRLIKQANSSLNEADVSLTALGKTLADIGKSQSEQEMALKKSQEACEKSARDMDTIMGQLKPAWKNTRKKIEELKGSLKNPSEKLTAVVNSLDENRKAFEEFRQGVEQSARDLLALRERINKLTRPEVSQPASAPESPTELHMIVSPVFLEVGPALVLTLQDDLVNPNDGDRVFRSFAAPAFILQLKLGMAIGSGVAAAFVDLGLQADFANVVSRLQSNRVPGLYLTLGAEYLFGLGDSEFYLGPFLAYNQRTTDFDLEAGEVWMRNHSFLFGPSLRWRLFHSGGHGLALTSRLGLGVEYLSTTTASGQPFSRFDGVGTLSVGLACDLVL